MNNKNLQAGLILAIIALSIHTVSNYTTKALTTKVTSEAKKAKVTKEKTMVNKDENQNNNEVKNDVNEKQVSDVGNDTNVNNTTDANTDNSNANNGNNKTNINTDTNTNTNKNNGTVSKDNKVSDAAKLKHCYNKNGKLYYKGVCVPIPKGFTYLMNQDGFMAYADSSYTNILMIYVKEHNMDNASDGIEAFTYGFGVSSLIESGPKNIVFGKNKYQLYKIKTDSVSGYSTSATQGIKAYAYVTANNSVATYVQVLTMSNNIKWAKAPLTYLSYY